MGGYPTGGYPIVRLTQRDAPRKVVEPEVILQNGQHSSGSLNNELLTDRSASRRTNSGALNEGSSSVVLGNEVCNVDCCGPQPEFSA